MHPVAAAIHAPWPADLSAEVLSQVADALPWPLLVLRPDATVMHANLAARRVLQRGRPLRQDQGGHVRAALPGQQAAFEAALADASFGGKRHLLHWQGPEVDAECAATIAPLASTPARPAALLLALAAVPKPAPATVNRSPNRAG